MKKTITTLLVLIASLSLGLIINFLFNLNWLISGLIIFIVLLSHSLLAGISEKFTGGLTHKDQESDKEKSEFRSAVATQVLLIVFALIGIIISILIFD